MESDAYNLLVLQAVNKWGCADLCSVTVCVPLLHTRTSVLHEISEARVGQS